MALKHFFSKVMIIILFLNFLTLYSFNASAAPSSTRIFVDPPETRDPAIGVGSNFSIEVKVENVTDLYGWSCNLTFRPNVVQILSLTFSTWMADASGWTALPLQTINNTAGWAAIGQVLHPFATSGATGDGSLVTVTFNVTSVGATYLDLTLSKLNTKIHGTNVPIPHVAEHGVFDNRIGNTAPVAIFSVDPPAANVSDIIEFNASGSHDSDNGWIVSYYWDYGDNTNETHSTAETTHIYSRAGIFIVTLTVTDNDGATDTTTASVSINGRDIAVTKVKSSHIAVMQGAQVTVNATVANLGNYTETFNVRVYYNETALGLQEITDMPPQTETILTFTWNTTGVDLGTYVLKANATIVEDEYNTGNNEYVDGIVTIALTNIIYYPVIVGGFTFYVVVESTSTTSNFHFNLSEKKISFTVAGENDTTGVSNVTIPIDLLGGPYTVLFDGSPIIPAPQETTNGTHTFLYFTYNHSSHTLGIIGQTVATPPVAVFTTSTTRAIAYIPVTFNATDSEDPDGTIESYEWDFDDGNVTIVDYPIIEHAYTAAGNYTVTLTVKDNKQLTNSTQAEITVVDYPKADFSYSPTTPLVDEEVTFNASTSEPNGGLITSYHWNFGDDTTGDGITATHTYSAVGNFVVVLNVTDSEGLWNIKSKTVTVSIHNIAVTEITATPTTVKIGQQVSINITVANKGNFTETFNVTAYFDSQTIQTSLVPDMASGTSQIINMMWNTAGINPATYTIKAAASKVAEETETNDNTLTGNTVTIQKLDSQLSISVSSETITVGTTVTINGTLNPVRESVSITVYFRLVGEQTWGTLTTVTTNTQGQYTYDWEPADPGTYEVKANWQGDQITLPSESNIQTIAVEEPSVPPITLYVVGAVIVVAIIAAALYFLKIRKP